MIKRGIILFVIVLFSLNYISALESGYCVAAEVSDISPSSIEIGEEFTVGIQIENCGDEIPEQISFELLNPPTDIIIKEPLIVDIPKLYYANSERFITYHMKTTEDAQSGTYVIKTRLSYGKTENSRTKDYNITINVIGDEAELSVASVKTDPVLPYKGETVELTLRIENFGDGTANAVKIYVNHSFKGIKESFIGTLDSDEDGPAVFTFIPNKIGEFEIPVTINYKDDFGDNEIQTKINLTILRKKISWFLILFVIAIVLFAIWGFRNYARLKRTKNKIIHQLLSGEKTEEKEIKIPEIKTETDAKKKERESKEKRKREFKREVLKKYKK